MCGYTRLNRIRNKVIKSKIGVANIEDKIRYARFRWFGHTRRRSMDAPVRKREMKDRLEHRRSRGRSKKSWNEVIKNDSNTLGLVEEIAQDRRLWRTKIKVTDFG